jgi:hypothetical protein
MSKFKPIKGICTDRFEPKSYREIAERYYTREGKGFLLVVTWVKDKFPLATSYQISQILQNSYKALQREDTLKKYKPDQSSFDVYLRRLIYKEALAHREENDKKILENITAYKPPVQQSPGMSGFILFDSLFKGQTSIQSEKALSLLKAFYKKHEKVSIVDNSTPQHKRDRMRNAHSFLSLLQEGKSLHELSSLYRKSSSVIASWYRDTFEDIQKVCKFIEGKMN